LPVWKKRLDAKTLVTTPNSDVIYAMSYLDLGKDRPIVFYRESSVAALMMIKQNPIAGTLLPPMAPSRRPRLDRLFDLSLVGMLLARDVPYDHANRCQSPQRPSWCNDSRPSALPGVPSTARADQLSPQPLPPSPEWKRALPPGPDTRVKITEEYAKHIARDAYFWAWPLVNIFNRRQAFKDAKEIVMAGPVPTAPLNRFAMLTDYITPDQRIVACPNQDVVYGAGSLALDITPVVIQVPDFGDRFWVYQVVDLRTDGVVQLGKMYGTTPGFYMLIGPDWQGEVPKGITKVFRSPTNTGFIAPRVFQDDTPEDKRSIQSVLQQILMYPLTEYDGTMKRMDWSQIRKLPPAAASGEAETQWVFPRQIL
jgi:hypothetical protein